VQKLQPAFPQVDAIFTRFVADRKIRFPEDNPWGDQQLAASDADLTKWLKLGVPFSTPPDTRCEYSNYAFALCGSAAIAVSNRS
jgi:CubicO group peptidase (beta-lactamase class C family)